MAIKTYTEQLEEVQAAITSIVVHGQSYTITDGGTSRTLNRGSLAELYKRETYLRAMADREAGGGMRVTHGVPFQ
jgi:hypothetical protein